MKEWMNVADMVNPDTGKTYRQENNERKHKYVVGEYVELDGEQIVRITAQSRDCDGTPLYSYETNGLSEDSISRTLGVFKL